MDYKILIGLSERIKYQAELDDLWQKELQRRGSVQSLLFLQELLNNNKAVNSQTKDRSTAPTQVYSLKSENEKLKHSLIAQKAMFESKIDTLKKSNQSLKAKINQSNQKKLKDLKTKSPDFKRKSMIPTRNPNISANISLSAAPTIVPKKVAISDFSTTPYLKKFKDSTVQTTPKSPYGGNKSYMSPTIASRKKMEQSMLTSTPQLKIFGNSPLRNSKIGESPKLTEIIKQRRKSGNFNNNRNKLRKSLTGALIQESMIEDDKENDDLLTKVHKSNNRTKQATGKNVSNDVTNNGKRKLNGAKRLLDDDGDESMLFETVAIRQNKLSKTGVGKVQLMSKLGNISPLKKKSKNIFQI